MRIGLFTDNYFPNINGVSASVSTLRESLELLGHDVYVFATTNPGAPPQEDHIIRIPSIPVFAGQRLGAVAYPHFMKTVEDLKLDLIHTQTEFSIGILGRRAARKLGLPLVHTMHTIYEDYTHFICKVRRLEPPFKVAARKLSASFCNSADRVIAPTEKIADMLRRYGTTKDITVIPTGIKLSMFPGEQNNHRQELLRAELNISEDAKVIINIGRVSKEKNIMEILNAMKDYLPQRRDVRFVIVGDGTARQELELSAQELGINDQVIFTGEQPWELIGEYYSLGDVFVNASQSESQGLTYIEALASGVPIVAKTDQCLEDVLIDGFNGFFFSDEAEMTEALDRVLYDQKLREKLSEHARETSKKFSAEHFAESILTQYEELMGHVLTERH